MRKKSLPLVFFLLLLTFCLVKAQAPPRISYQTVVRQSSGQLVTNQVIRVRISVLSNSSSGNTVYREIHQPTSNSNGLVTFIIGDGNEKVGELSEINWSSGIYFLRTEIDPTGGSNYVLQGTTQFLSVPYALYAESAGNSSGIPGPPGPQGPQGLPGVGINILGSFASESQLPEQGSSGDGYLINGLLFVWSENSATWENVGNIQGPAGAAGPMGIQGQTGNDGRTILSGSVDPSNAIGNIGDFFINTNSNSLFGPKAQEGWGNGTPLVGPAGPAGLQGATGAIGPQGLLLNGTAPGVTPFWNGTQWVVNSTNIFNNGENIGIGTSNPQAKLDIINTPPSNISSEYNSVYVGTLGGANNAFYRGIHSVIESLGEANRAMQGYSSGYNSNFNQGLTGFADNSSGTNDGVLGRSGESSTVSSNFNIGVRGIAGNSNNSNIAISANITEPSSESNTGDNYGLSANANAITTGTNYGVYSESFFGGSTNYAGYFVGNVSINGNLTVNGNISKFGGTFKIDHPLNPKEKYLVHSFVESPEMLNVYSGNVTTDDEGIAVVNLPEYFEAANKDFRYQLTCMGTFSQAIILKEIKNNQFTIKTEKANVKVSWMIQGVRSDPYAEKNRIVPEQEKEASEKGQYLYPEAFGLPARDYRNAKATPPNSEAIRSNKDK